VDVEAARSTARRRERRGQIDPDPRDRRGVSAKRRHIEFAGRAVAWSSPREATAAGIHVIYQEFNLFPHLSVAENIYLGHERRNALGIIDRRRARRDAREILERLGVDIDPDALVEGLPVADQQMVEIARALVHEVKLLILDEPTGGDLGRESTCCSGVCTP